jgi:hypothetical protein
MWHAKNVICPIDSKDSTRIKLAEDIKKNIENGHVNELYFPLFTMGFLAIASIGSYRSTSKMIEESRQAVNYALEITKDFLRLED